MAANIRRTTIEDAAAIAAIYAQPHAHAGTLQLPYPTTQMWRARVESLSPEMHNLVAEVDGKIVGQLSLNPCTNPRRKHVAEFGMGVCSSMLNQGVGSALLSAAIELCDRWLQITRIELEVYTDNEAAITLYKKHGFVIEGEFKQHAFRDGKYVDSYAMARIK